MTTSQIIGATALVLSAAAIIAMLAHLAWKNRHG